MSDVTAVPGAIAAAATDVAAVGSTVDAAHMTAAAPTVAVVPAAADEVSAGIANLFSGFAKEYQALAGQASAFQQQFVQHLHASAGSYTAAEAANSGSMAAGIQSTLERHHQRAGPDYSIGLSASLVIISKGIHLLMDVSSMSYWFSRI